MKKNLLIIISCIVLTAFIYTSLELLVPAQSNSKNIEIEIPVGTTFRQAMDILYNQKLIRDKKVFLMLGRLTGSDRKIRAGYYSIWGNMSPLDIFRIIRKGQIIEYEIRIIEGDSLLEIADAVAGTGIMTKEDFIKISKDKDFLDSYDIESNSIEGYIFPDTYKIPKGVRAEDALGLMIDRMREKFSDELYAKSVELNMTENEVLTLASIIEKEAVLDSERPLISAVYHNRLKKKMPLQADPTAIYGIKSSKEKITRSDLMHKSPYNTYVINGLPPGPIASPGLKSIIAALYPADVPYLYFVSQDNRAHQFSTTAAEHLEAVRLYRGRKQEIKNNVEEKIGGNGAS
ncbi:MAG: endolytic transglycosylase MltG [Nitrospirota bacterium]